MDHLGIAAFATFLVAARGAGSISKAAGERPGGLAGELCELVADRLRGDASGEKALAEAQAKPDSEIKQTALQAAIAGKMEEDADFAEEILRLVETIRKEDEGAGSSAFDQREQKVDGPQTNIAGGGQGAVFSGQFNCPLSMRGDAIDLRGSKGAVIKPGGSVSQHFGDVNIYQSGERESSNSRKKPKNIKALFLASNPKDTLALEIDREVREITEKIRATEYRDCIELISAWSVRPDDLLQLLNQHRPQIVHFSGHGSKSGEIILSDICGERKPVNPAAIKALFQTLKGDIRVVILNACYSKIQAEAIRQEIDCAIGMNDAIGDEAAIVFAASFYRAIGFGLSVKQAFDQGIVALLLEGIPEESKPELLVREGVDPGKIVLIKPENESNSPEINRLFFIPEPPSDFTGRDEELAQLLKKFSTGRNAILLHGNGGVGKTALALKLAQSLKDRYPDGQIMVDMMGTTDPISSIEAMGSIINSFNPEEKIPDSKAKVMQRFQQVLNGKRILLLLDSALNDKQLSGLISPPNGCGLLITSRNVISGLFRKDIGVLKLEHAVKLLLGICFTALGKEKSSRDDPSWPKIARLCGFLPLALRAAASFLANSEDISPKEYAQQLENERTRLEMIGEQGVEMSVDASFGLSFQRLAPAIQKTFLDLSVFPADFDSQAEEIICHDKCHRHLSELVRWSLVEYHCLEADEDGRYRLHDLMRLFANSYLDQTARCIGQQNHAEYFKNVLSKIDELYVKGGKDTVIGRDLFRLEWINIKAGQMWAEDTIVSKSEKMDQALRLACDYASEGAYALGVLLNPNEMIRWLNTAILASQQLRNSKIECSHLVNLGIAYCHVDKIQEAINLFQQCYSISKKIGYTFGEFNALGNIGAAYAMIGETSKAIEFFEQCLFIARMNSDRRGESNSLGNLGLTYYNFGNIGQAIEDFEESLEINREIGNRQGEGANLGNLGLVYENMGNIKKAIEYYEQHLAIAREIGDRRGEGNALGNLGLAYADLGDARKSIEYHEQALAIAREIGDRRGEGNALGNLGLAYADLGDARKSIEYHEQALAIAREIGDRRGEANASWNLGISYEKAGYLKRAAELMQICVTFEREIGHLDAENHATRLEAILAKLKN